jgi:hypothetical protein
MNLSSDALHAHATVAPTAMEQGVGIETLG